VRSAVIGSGLAHVAILVFLFTVRAAPPVIVPGPDVVQVALLEPGSIPTMPAPRAPVEHKPEPVSIAPSEETGVRLSPSKTPKQKVEARRADRETPAVPQLALPYASVGSAGLRGQIAVDGADFEFTYYLLLVRNRVAQNWAPPAGLTHGGQPVRAVVHFRIARGGGVTGLRLETPSGFEYFDRSALRAVQISDPLPPLPLGYAGADLGIHFGFDFVAP
jgi:TonB family protein